MSNCVEFTDNRRICTAEENGKKYELRNSSATLLKKVKIDKCIAQKTGEKRCDFLIQAHDLNRSIFIELKGGNLNNAVNQIYDTITFLKDELINNIIDARIVGSKDVPGFTNTPDYKKLAREVLTSNGTIKRSTNKIYIESI
jgi:hypothetical protein